MLKTKLSRLGKESGKTTSAIISYQIWFSCDRLLLKFVISPMRLWRMFLNHEIAEFFYDQLYTWIPGLFRHKRRPMKGIQANFSLSLCMYTYALNGIDMWKCMYTCHFQIHALTHTQPCIAVHYAALHLDCITKYTALHCTTPHYIAYILTMQTKCAVYIS